MTGGRIVVEGNAGDWVGGEMHGGLIQVAGSAGHLIGAAYRGSKRGMTDGTILIGGDVGSEIGAAMRRGSLAVGGSCGDAAGFGMIAGSILVFGSCGIRIGAGMRRGTIGLFGPDPPDTAAHLPTSRLLPPAFSALLLPRAGAARVSRSRRQLDGRAVALPWRPGRAGQGRGLDESRLTSSRQTRLFDDPRAILFLRGP